MKIWVYTIVRNEAKLMPWWLKHYQGFCERIIVYDDQSNDGTQAIVRAAGGEVRSLPYAGLDDECQALFASLMYREARGQADLVIVVDGDEFLYGQINPNWTFPTVTGYQMVARGLPDSTSPGQLYDYIPNGYAYPPESKPTIFRPELDLHFGAGRHYANRSWTESLTELKLLHFRFIGREEALARSQENYQRIPAHLKTSGYGGHVYPENRERWADQIEKDAREYAVRVVE